MKIIVNQTYVNYVEINNTNFYNWNDICDALDMHDFSPRYYQCEEIYIQTYPNKLFISEDDLQTLIRKAC